MTATYSRGRISIPAEVRKDLKLRDGDKVEILRSATGEIRLVPVRRRKPRKSLFDALRALKGLEIPDRHDPIRPIKL